MSRKFEHLRKLQVRSDVVQDFDLLEIEGNPLLKVKPALEGNRAYFTSLLKRNKRYAQQLRTMGMTPELMDKTREEDRELYARFVIVGWESVVDSENKDVKFSTEDCLAFLRALPDYIFDQVRQFCSTPGNFVKNFDDDQATAGNSETGSSGN